MIEILYENRDFAVCVKPTGVLSESGESGRVGMPELLGEQLYGRGGRPLLTVHRLDAGVGGVMVYAKNKNACAKLSAQVTDKTVRKEYLAAVHGRMDPPSGDMKDFLFKDSRKNKTFVVKKERKGVKDASLAYETLATGVTRYGEASLVRVELHTGRTHQIRVQFSSRRHPLIGDGKYGGSDNGAAMGLWLRTLSFTSPTDGKAMTFTAEPPETCAPWSEPCFAANRNPTEEALT